jgi:hypothetical protein
MRNILAVAALLVFVVSSGALEAVRKDDRPIAAVLPALAIDAPVVAVDGTAVTSAVVR